MCGSRQCIMRVFNTTFQTLQLSVFIYAITPQLLLNTVAKKKWTKNNILSEMLKLYLLTKNKSNSNLPLKFVVLFNFTTFYKILGILLNVLWPVYRHQMEFKVKNSHRSVTENTAQNFLFTGTYPAQFSTPCPVKVKPFP